MVFGWVEHRPGDALVPVRIVTDSSSCLPHDTAEELGIKVLDLHVMPPEESGEEAHTAGLTALELVAAYARQLERGGDEGVVALHLSKDLSSTYASAESAAAVFDDVAEPVRVVETSTIGMCVGAAAMAAATVAGEGGSVDECVEAASSTLERSEMFLYVDKVEGLRKSGRLSTTDALVSAALATRPIMQIKGGRIELAAKTRTPTKAFAKLIELIVTRANSRPVFIALQEHQASEAAARLSEAMESVLPEGSTFMTVPMSEVLAVHAGPGSIAVSAVFSE